MTSVARWNARLSKGAERLAALSGRRRYGASMLAGVAAALAMAPFYFLPLMALGYSAFLFVLEGSGTKRRPGRAAFAAGWWFGFGYFLVGLYWMAFSFFVQAEEFAWMAPFAMLGMPAFLGLFSGVAAWAYHRLKRHDGGGRILLFAAIWVAVEYARGHVLSGLPWNLPGQALAGAAAGAQTSAWYGVYGLSLVAVLLALLPAAWPGRMLKGAACSLAGAATLFAVGFVRLGLGEAGVSPDMHVRIVQPNISQREKIDPTAWSRNFRRNLDLSTAAAPADAKAAFIIWPENAAPLLNESRSALDVLTTALPENATLIAGTVRREARDERDVFFNAISIIPPDPQGRKATAYYDKHHLVPFGEYLPMQGFLRAIGLAQLAPYEDGFTPGPGPSTLSAGGSTFSPLICYEAIFPGESYPRGARPDWLVTVTNDAWFGDTSGPRQHLDQARLRSIELGLPMARSANTGVSALIDAKGRYVERIGLYQAGVIDAPLPNALAPTLYARIGDLLYILMTAAFLALGFFGVRFRAAPAG